MYSVQYMYVSTMQCSTSTVDSWLLLSWNRLANLHVHVHWKPVLSLESLHNVTPNLWAVNFTLDSNIYVLRAQFTSDTVSILANFS